RGCVGAPLRARPRPPPLGARVQERLGASAARAGRPHRGVRGVCREPRRAGPLPPDRPRGARRGRAGARPIALGRRAGRSWKHRPRDSARAGRVGPPPGVPRDNGRGRHAPVVADRLDAPGVRPADSSLALRRDARNEDAVGVRSRLVRRRALPGGDRPERGLRGRRSGGRDDRGRGRQRAAGSVQRGAGRAASRLERLQGAPRHDARDPGSAEAASQDQDRDRGPLPRGRLDRHGAPADDRGGRLERAPRGGARVGRPRVRRALRETAPHTLRAAILRWYLKHRRDLPWRSTQDPYAIWVSEIMLQQTRVETVIPYYRRFLERFPNVRSLAKASEADVLARWSGLGYYGRARNLRDAASLLVREHAAQLPEDPAALRRLPGVGEYTAAAISSVAFGRPVAAVDGNVIRVLTRIHGLRGRRDSTALRRRVNAIAETLAVGPRPGDWTQALMELGATVCLPREPLCERCPARTPCIARRSGHADRYPEAAPVAAPKQERRVILLAR